MIGVGIEDEGSGFATILTFVCKFSVHLGPRHNHSCVVVPCCFSGLHVVEYLAMFVLTLSPDPRVSLIGQTLCRALLCSNLPSFGRALALLFCFQFIRRTALRAGEYRAGLYLEHGFPPLGFRGCDPFVLARRGRFRPSASAGYFWLIVC